VTEARVEWAPGAEVGLEVAGVGDGRYELQVTRGPIAEVGLEVAGVGDVVFVLAHGAGAHRDHPAMVGLRDALVGRGITVVTFDYPYAAEGRRAPDRAPKLLACHRAVVGWVREHVPGRLVLGGRSMGGRMASMLVAEGVACTALVLYSYPLHPPGRPDRLRIDHLDDIAVPTLVVWGTRDPFASRELVDVHLRSRFEVAEVEGAGHSFEVPRRTLEEVQAEVAEATVDWLMRLA